MMMKLEDYTYKLGALTKKMVICLNEQEL